MTQHNAVNVSSTAHYTGQTWIRNGLSHEAFSTPEGAWLHALVSPLDAFARLAGSPTLEGLLLARHRAIDVILHRAIEQGQVSQIIEVAAGLSPRGWRFKQIHGPALRYVEADLPDMAQLKRDLLLRSGLISPGHEVVPFDALAEHGPLSINALASTLEPQRGVAIITEGLLMYLDKDAVLGMWARFATVLRRFPHGLYLSDLHATSLDQGLLMKAFRPMLSAFVRGRVQWHFEQPEQAAEALLLAGFSTAQAVRPAAVLPRQQVPAGTGPEVVRVITAST
jgi:O-methyltransferase involved in polyketide biosynthesis